MPMLSSPTYRLILGDSAIAMGEIPDASVDLIVTSPPYDDARIYAGEWRFDFKAIAGHCKQVLKKGGVLVWVVGDQTVNGSETGTSFRQALHFMELGMKLHDTMIFGKENPVPLTHNRYEQEFEFMFVLSNGKPKTWNPILMRCVEAGKRTGGSHYIDTENLERFHGYGKPIKDKKYRSNIWKYGVGNGKDFGEDIKGHPAHFPIGLPSDHIVSWSNPGDIVLDPFSGSCQTGVAAYRLRRNFIGIEIHPEYYQIGERRMKLLSQQGSLLDLLPMDELAAMENTGKATQQEHEGQGQGWSDSSDDEWGDI